jgi:hypothetical protein
MLKRFAQRTVSTLQLAKVRVVLEIIETREGTRTLATKRLALFHKIWYKTTIISCDGESRARNQSSSVGKVVPTIWGGIELENSASFVGIAW